VLPQVAAENFPFCLTKNAPPRGGRSQVFPKFLDSEGKMRRIISAVLWIAALAVPGYSQTFRGAINGSVTDPSGAVIEGATVKATELATNIDHATISSSDGQFSFQDLPLGFYKVTVSATGFPDNTVDRVEVVAGTIYTLTVKLRLAQNVTTVEINAAAITLDTTTQTQSMTIPDDVVQNLPLNGRDFTQMIAVQPGFGGYNVGGFGSLNGTRPNQINWQIDGVDNNDFWHNIPAVNQGGVSGIAGVVLPMDSIVEFSSQTQSGPEGGRNAGGTVNVVTRSGTNDFHGSVYYYNRNEYYAAHTPFLPAGSKAPPLRNENYGASLGGPIVKRKLFFFTNYEKQDFIIGLSGIATEPSDAWVNQALGLLKSYGVTVSAASANAIGPNGFWPRSGSGSIAALPATLNNYFAPIAETGYSYNGVGRVDYEISDKHHLYLRAYLGQGNQIAPLGGSPALGTASSNLKDYFEVAPIHVGNYSGVLNSTLTPKITNQLLFGANYFNQIFHDFNNGFNTKSMGIYLSPDATNKGQYILGAPNIVIGPKSGIFEQIGLTPPEGRSDLTWHISDIVSQNIGAHQLRYGVEVRQAHLNEFYHRRGTGKFTFDGTQGPWASSATCTSSPALCSLTDFLAGDVSTSTITVGNPERWVKVNAFNAYVQDSWELTKRLTLNFGLRYEYFGPMHSDKKDIANFIPGTGFVVQGVNGKSLFDPGKNHFAPRIGFAYQPRGSGDLVVRGGFGVYYDQINLNPFLDFRPPISAPSGIQGNPFGTSPLSTYSMSAYNWDAVQAGGASIFPGVIECANPLCTSTTPATAAIPKFSLYSVSSNFRVPYFFNYNVQVEKGFGNVGVFQVGYVGSQGRKLNLVSNINQNGAFPNFGNILQLNTAGTSNYNALQTVFRTRGWHGLSSQFAYTWSHSLDQISEYRGAILDNAFNKRADYGNSDFDTRHLFTVSLTYDVPRARWAESAWSKRVFNGWQVSSIMNFHAGQPFDETLSGLNVIGDPFSGVSHSFNSSLPGVQWLNPSAFCDPSKDPACGGGPVSRNRYVGPNFKDVDVSVIKNVPITERFRLQLRADMFNLFNRINFASGAGSVGLTCSESPTLHHCTTGSGFGQVNDTIGDFNGAPGLGPGEQFNMQLAVKLIF
jgi:Carboxypeptidase regulatory-like domain/TonB dependent receptor